MSTTRDLEHAAELLLRVLLSVNDGLISRIVDCQNGHPGAGRWDLERSSGTPWCWTHERDLRNCHQEGWGCLADDIVGTMSDPAGDAGVRSDVAAVDMQNFTRAAERLYRDVKLMANINDAYPPTRPANAYERQQTADVNDPRCESCARHEVSKGVAWWQDIHPNLKNRTTVKARLKEPMYLCKFCYEHVIDRGCLPNLDEIAFREKWNGTKDKHLPCPHPKAATEDVA